MKKIINPNYKNENDLRNEKYAAVISNYIAALPTTERFIDFNKIRADIVAMNLEGVTAADVTDEKLINICKNNKIFVLDE
jgi:Rad3-related DNA helicase